MRKLGWLKKKGNRKELAGKKPTKFNTTKFVQLQSDLREHQSNLLDFESERAREDAEVEEVEEITQESQYACTKCDKVSSSEKGIKIHMKKSHIETEELEDNPVQVQTQSESTELKCDICSKTSSSLKGLKIHKTKSH